MGEELIKAKFGMAVGAWDIDFKVKSDLGAIYIIDTEELGVTDYLHQDPNTPKGFRFLTNLGQYDQDEALAEMYENWGAENIVVTKPAYDVYGREWDGIAIHVRDSEVRT